MDKLNITKNIGKFLDKLDEQNYHMLEDEIDIEIQNKYFKNSSKLSNNIVKEDVMANVPLLNDQSATIDDKKRVLNELASLRDVEAFRVLEKICKQFDNEELNQWSVMAYNESKMMINGTLKGVQQIFISTGLGGKEGKLRYFVVLLPDASIECFTDFHKKFITKELAFTLEKNDAFLEKVLEQEDDYLSYKVLIPIKTDIQKLFKKVLKNCNQLSSFVSKQFIITNVNEMNRDEIEDFIDDIQEDDDNNILDDIISLN